MWKSERQLALITYRNRSNLQAVVKKVQAVNTITNNIFQREQSITRPKQKRPDITKFIINEIINNLGTTFKKLPEESRIAKIYCNLPTNTKPYIKKMNITLSDDLKGSRIKMLWTGYENQSQHVACTLADTIRKYGSAYALEQTDYPAAFTKEYGLWDDELKIIKEKVMERDNQLEQEKVTRLSEYIRKQIWDHISKLWAEDNRFKYVIVVVPEIIDKTKTLCTIELPHLYKKSKICVLKQTPTHVMKNSTRIDIVDKTVTLTFSKTDFKANKNFICSLTGKK